MLRLGPAVLKGSGVKDSTILLLVASTEIECESSAQIGHIEDIS